MKDCEIYLSKQFYFAVNDDTVSMFGEHDGGPFNRYLIGDFIMDSKGYYRFMPSQVYPMTCKMLFEAAKKCSILNLNKCTP